jgi:phosphate transport system permease protein
MSLEEREQYKRKRRRKDKFYDTTTLIASFFGLLSLVAIFTYVLIKGSGLLSWELLTGDYYSTTYHLMPIETNYCSCSADQELDDGVYYSEKWGIGLKDSIDREGHSIVVVSYVHEDSPLRDYVDLTQIDNIEDIPKEDLLKIEPDLEVENIKYDDGTITISKRGAMLLVESLEEDHGFIKEFNARGGGGGIRSSLIATLYLIGMSLVFALPIGIFTAIYLNEYAKKNFITNQLRRFIEMLTGVPSIIFGMVGLVVFIPLTSLITKMIYWIFNVESSTDLPSFLQNIDGLTGRNLIAASMTLAVIILPTIIRSTEESLKVIPTDLRQASLALGANKTQTTFKVVLPNALPGILTAVLLGIGRIIGESAALIFVLGVTIVDKTSIFSSSTSLSVQIWTVMGGEEANFELASAISLIILVVVLSLNLIVKYISYRLDKAWR